jgi:hypothetical protein
MKKIQKRSRFLLLQVAASLVIVFSIGSCINECDTSNSTYLVMEFDTLGTAVSVPFKVFTEYGTLTDTSNAYGHPLNLSIDSARLPFFIDAPKNRPPSDSLPSSYDTIVFTYTRKTFQRGPDCGFDVKINDLKVKSYTEYIIDTVFITASTLSSSQTTNVKIRLKTKP